MENDPSSGSFRAGKPHLGRHVNKSLKNGAFALPRIADWHRLRIGTRSLPPPVSSEQATSSALGPGRPFAARLMVGEYMTEILRKTASTWLPVALTAAVVGIGIAVAAW